MDATADGARIEVLLGRMTLEEKIGQMMVVAFRVWKEVPETAAETDSAVQEDPGVNVTELNDAIRQCIARYHFGGILLYAQNCRDAEQVLRLTADMQAASLAGGGLPLLIAADQEGGSVARLSFGTSGVGNMALAATGDPENAAFPIALQPGDSALILFADSCASRVGTGELARQLLAERGALPENAEITVMKNTADNAVDCLAAADRAEYVILVSRVYTPACLDSATEDGFSTAVFDQIIAARHAAGRPVIVVSCQIPYDAARFPDADAMLLCYGSSPMRSLLPATGEGSDYVPNLAAVLCACFGEEKPIGKLPVSLPILNDQYRPTQKILYMIQQ